MQGLQAFVSLFTRKRVKGFKKKKSETQFEKLQSTFASSYMQYQIENGVVLVINLLVFVLPLLLLVLAFLYTM